MNGLCIYKNRPTYIFFFFIYIQVYTVLVLVVANEFGKVGW